MKILTTLLFFILAWTSHAHVILDYPEGGETFSTGETVTIKWHIDIDHGGANWDLYFSRDAGDTWEVLQADMAKSRLEFRWTIPDSISTDEGLIRIVQDNDIGVMYDDISRHFTIEELSTDTRDPRELAGLSMSIAPNPSAGMFRISCHIPTHDHVVIEVCDMSGHVIEALLDRNLAAGTYDVSWDAVDFSPGLYVCRLTVGAYGRSSPLLVLR